MTRGSPMGPLGGSTTARVAAPRQPWISFRRPCDNPASCHHNVDVAPHVGAPDLALSARRLAQRVTALPDLGMRQVSLAEALAAASADDAVALVAELLHASRVTPGHPFTATLAALAG